MMHELKKIGETFNTEYSVYGTDIFIVVPAPGYKDNVSPRGWMIALASRYK